MAIKKREEIMVTRLGVDLLSVQGQPTFLKTLARNLAIKTGKNGDAIVAEMEAGDYEHLIAVLDREFGDIVDLYR